jgi:hypothetical protein
VMQVISGYKEVGRAKCEAGRKEQAVLAVPKPMAGRFRQRYGVAPRSTSVGVLSIPVEAARVKLPAPVAEPPKLRRASRMAALFPKIAPSQVVSITFGPCLFRASSTLIEQTQPNGQQRPGRIDPGTSLASMVLQNPRLRNTRLHGRR